MKKWYLFAILAGLAMFAINFLFNELHESMLYVAGALACLGSGGLAGSVNPIGPLSQGPVQAQDASQIELPAWRHRLANLLLFAGAILFIMSLFK